MNPNRIVIIGAGGNGSWLSLFMGWFLAYDRSLNNQRVELAIVDFDTYEDNNKARQFFTKPGNKAESLAATLTALFQGNVKVRAIPKRVVSWDDAALVETDEVISPEELISDGSVVFLCVDRFYPRLVVSQFAQTLDNVLVINGGTGVLDWQVDIYLREKGVDCTQPIEITHPEIIEKAEKERLALLGYLTLPPVERLSCTLRMETDEAAQTLVSNISTASDMFKVFANCVAGSKLTASSLEGALEALANGLWGPATRISQ